MPKDFSTTAWGWRICSLNSGRFRKSSKESSSQRPVSTSSIMLLINIYILISFTRDIYKWMRLTWTARRANDQLDGRQSDPCPRAEAHTGPRDSSTSACWYYICVHYSSIPNRADDECEPTGLNSWALWARRLCRMHSGRARLLGELWAIAGPEQRHTDKVKCPSQQLIFNFLPFCEKIFVKFREFR